MIVSTFNSFAQILFVSFLIDFCLCQERASEQNENIREESISSAQDRGVILHIDITC